ncbi:hypothetical protein ACW9HR_21975 [Nocardia gipuzkoensis]
MSNPDETGALGSSAEEHGSMGRQPDYVAMFPDGTVFYGARIRDQDLYAAICSHVPNPSSKDVGRLRAWVAEEGTYLSLQPQNRLAGEVLHQLGCNISPHYWRGPVLLTMEENPSGDTPPLAADVREHVHDLLMRADDTGKLASRTEIGYLDPSQVTAPVPPHVVEVVDDVAIVEHLIEQRGPVQVVYGSDYAPANPVPDWDDWDAIPVIDRTDSAAFIELGGGQAALDIDSASTELTPSTPEQDAGPDL